MSRKPSIMDDISKAIIEQLQADGRMPYAAIGKVVGLSEAAVRQRVQRLVDADMLQFAAITNPAHVGFHRQAMVGIHATGDVERLAKKIGDIPEVTYVVVTAGSFDLLAEVVCEDDEQLLAIVNQRIRRLPEVHSSETFVYMKLTKQTYTWGTR